MAFTSGRRPAESLELPALWFVLDRGRVLVRCAPEGPSFLDSRDVEILDGGASGLFLGATERRSCLLAHGDAAAPVPEGMEWVELRSLFSVVDEELFWIAGRAGHLAGWDLNHRRCGACGAALVLKDEEWAKACPACGQIYYPQISPAIIASVVQGDRILLARNQHYRYPFFSVLAGFVEPGESLESAVHREIREEVGLAVKNLRYFGSQPWPFPNSLMIGFTAEYAGGELRPDPSEILEARWFTRDAMPEIPSSISIARKLIDAFLAGNGTN
jgi:NAD+ diphosphatase